ncbi:Diaminohydroxyphosphoribosylamino-pyrimidine deaminase [Colletotrichum sp. SAR 10_70]|nr:Diaminohydroxyphosphoribosylamino-pyrimidine deaminase [Colletotrichum sp. SAR 10_71]KAI8194334.1 Diaminohydroxyphosphoribosylamino-pyrimidine deaminase [Colletotrichum sp. SAR 10_70]KAI8213133.1 Diaminohydroxyphosphoribosylamino-pyrimidine deaminase [Colletotrichum sp. SAR 10_76]
MAVKALISTLEDEILDPEEGFIDPKATTLSLTLADRDFTIHQSPTVLSSTRAGGTTGAVLWKITPLFATYLSSPTSPFNPIFTPTSTVLELGCGISPLTALLLAPRISRYILTDQPYVSRMIHQNLEANPLPSSSTAAKPSSRRKKTTSTTTTNTASSGLGSIQFTSLDWELDTPTPSLTGSPSTRSFDAVVCCDCIYNEALVDPLVSTTADLARLRLRIQEEEEETDAEEAERSEPCVCIVAQQLRSPDVFEEWAKSFHKQFRMWRVPDELLPEGLRIDSGFVVHVGILRESKFEP